MRLACKATFKRMLAAAAGMMMIGLGRVCQAERSASGKDNEWPSLHIDQTRDAD
jgi:hypothetical protein